MSDPLANWWIHPVVIERREGEGPYGPAYAEPSTETGFVSGKRRMVRTDTGEQVVSTTTVALPADTPLIAPGSKVTLPAMFGGRTALVITSAVGDGGNNPTPDHIQVNLE